MVTPDIAVQGSLPMARTGGLNPPQQGFTLIELMIGLILVSIMLAIGVPMFREFIMDQRARTTSSDLSIALMLARSEAVKRNDEVTLTPGDDNDWGTGWTIANPDNSEPDILNHVQPGDITITAEGGLAQVRFSPSGRTLDAAVFEIDVDPQSDNLCRVVRLELDGRTSSEKEACSGG